MDWQPIETAPKDGTDILVWCQKGAAVVAWLSLLGEELWYVHADAEDFCDEWEWWNVEPTYWMPLPSPPRPLTRGEV